MSKEVRERKQLTVPPLIAIEVLDHADFYVDLKTRAADLYSMGVSNIWLVDPDLHIGEVWRKGSWQPERTGRLQALESPMYLDLDWLWQQLDEE